MVLRSHHFFQNYSRYYDKSRKTMMMKFFCVIFVIDFATSANFTTIC